MSTIRDQDPNGFKILFLVCCRNCPAALERARIFQEAILRELNIKSKLIYSDSDPYRNIINYMKMAREALLGSHKVVHIIEPFLPYILIWLFLKIRGKTIIYDSADLHYYIGKKSGGNKFFQSLTRIEESLAYKTSEYIIVRVDTARDIVSNLYRIKINNILFIPDGIDLNIFKLSDGDRLRAALKLNGQLIIGYASDIRILQVGKEFRARGWELLETAKLLQESGRTNFKILILGSGRGLDYLRKLGEKLEITDHVIYAGYVPNQEYPDYLKAMDICFIESIKDLSYSVMNPRKLREYLASSHGIIAGNLGEAKRTFNQNGVLVSPLSSHSENLNSYIDQIFKALCEVYDDRSLVIKFGNNSRQAAEEFYDWNTIAHDYIRFVAKTITS